MKKNIILVSHSKQITDGLKEMIDQMNQSDQVEVHSLGGTFDDSLGSDPMKILTVVNDAAPTEIFLVFADLGSAVMSSELAYDMLDEAQQKNYYLVDAPLVEGAFAAAITAGVIDDLDQIMAEAKKSGGKGWDK